MPPGGVTEESHDLAGVIDPESNCKSHAGD
jgi:hypothetical protein